MSETLTTERIEDFDALREVEEAWLAEHLSDAIANLGYPVGCGIAPHPETMAKAARNLFNHYAMMVELARSAADAELLALRKRVEWQDISTAPIGRKIDLWLWNIGEYDEPVDGFRFPEVELIGPVPHPFKYWDDDGEPKVFHPDENGQFVSHWRDVPEAPAMSLPTPKEPS